MYIQASELPTDLSDTSDQAAHYRILALYITGFINVPALGLLHSTEVPQLEFRAWTLFHLKLSNVSLGCGYTLNKFNNLRILSFVIGKLQMKMLIQLCLETLKYNGSIKLVWIIHSLRGNNRYYRNTYLSYNFINISHSKIQESRTNVDGKTEHIVRLKLCAVFTSL